LSHNDVKRNNSIASDRVINENFFGRQTTLWRASSATWKWSHELYDYVNDCCTAFTNYHIALHPLRAVDGERYNGYLYDLSEKGNEAVEKRKEAQRKYKEARRERLKDSKARPDYSHSDMMEDFDGFDFNF